MYYFLLFDILLVIFFTSHAQSQSYENDRYLSLVCPEGLMAKGLTWYAQTINTILSENDSSRSSQNFSVCVNCKPEKEGPYQWIEICFSNNDNILGQPFQWDTTSCGEPISVTQKQFQIFQKCQRNEPFCGIHLFEGETTLKRALKTAQPILCTGFSSERSKDEIIRPNSAGFDVDLLCPENTFIDGFQKIFLPASGGLIPAFSASCKLANNNGKDHLISVYAKGKLNNPVLNKIFSKSPQSKTKCNVNKENNK